MKKYIFMLCASLACTACIHNFDAEMASAAQMTAENVGEPNTTIAKLREMYKTQIANNTNDETAKVNDDLIIEGIVTGNDLSGNIYQSIYVQDVNNDGTIDSDNGGIQVCIKGVGSLASVFPAGQKIRMNLKGLYVSGYGKMPRIGQPYITTSSSPSVRIGPMAQTHLKQNIQLVGTHHANIVTPHEFTSADMDKIDKLTPLFVVMHGCKIKEADGKATYAPTETGVYSVQRTLQLADGKTVVMYNSCSASFSSDGMPTGKLTVYGIMTRYSSTWQLILRSVDDVVIEK